MTDESLRRLAEQLLRGDVAADAFVRQVSQATRPATADLGDANLDLDRRRRCGHAEVIFAEGKPPDSLRRIVERLVKEGVDVLATRVGGEQAAALAGDFSAGRYNDIARTFRLRPAGDVAEQPPRIGRVAVITAGTSDRPVAEEACETLDWMGVTWSLIQDIGVAGPHRLLEKLPEITPADAVVVAAGMEGALPSVVGGHVACPVVAVPTSVGYGASFGGLAALLGMLNSCAANVTVVNIDAGFKAGYVAGLIARRQRAR
ncbi:MAG: nickel pincer cofactor biosynthesis protein LarB [Pirellulales bacterium]